MTKSELINEVHGNFDGLTKKQTGEIVDALFSQIASTLQEEGRFSYPGFGIFNVKQNKARAGRNPRTGEKIKIPASKTVSFKPSSDLKNTVND